MAGRLEGKTIAFLTANERVEQVELTEPWQAVEEAGGTAVLLAPETGKVQLFEHLDKADSWEATAVVGGASAGDYDALVLPGGVANPDALRQDGDAVGFIRAFVESGKPVAAICHAPWTLVEAGVLEGRTITSWPSIATDIRNAGATWVDQEVCRDGNLLSSRKPDDLPAFCDALLRQVK